MATTKKIDWSALIGTEALAKQLPMTTGEARTLSDEETELFNAALHEAQAALCKAATLHALARQRFEKAQGWKPVAK